MELLFNKSGVPLMGYGTAAMYSTTGAPAMANTTSDKPTKVITPTNDDPDYTNLGPIEIADWGTGNTFPTAALTIIGKVPVLNSGLKFVRNFTLGQGIFPAKVTGYDEKGNEELTVVDDSDIIKLCKGRMVRRYMEKSARDYFKLGPSFVELKMNEDGSKIVGINAINARYCRLELANNGTINRCVVSGKWPDTPSTGEYTIYDVLDEYDPSADLFYRKVAGKTAKKSFIYVLRDSWSNNDYYSEPIWYAAFLAGWIDIANKVPTFLKKAYENQISWKWHVQIPYGFFDKKFRECDYATTNERQTAISDYMDTIEDNLCNTANANKAIFSFYEISEISGKAEEKWEITALDNKYKEGDKLVTSAAANSEILFAMMINPNVMGAGMPGGTYAGNQGGSNIREAYLVNIANAWIDRQNFLDPIELMIEYNGYSDVELRFRNTILTTLDTGAGTTQELS